jgi:hypothetical protein
MEAAQGIADAQRREDTLALLFRAWWKQDGTAAQRWLQAEAPAELRQRVARR